MHFFQAYNISATSWD